MIADYVERLKPKVREYLDNVLSGELLEDLVDESVGVEHIIAIGSVAEITNGTRRGDDDCLDALAASILGEYFRTTLWGMSKIGVLPVSDASLVANNADELIKTIRWLREDNEWNLTGIPSPEDVLIDAINGDWSACDVILCYRYLPEVVKEVLKEMIREGFFDEA